MRFTLVDQIVSIEPGARIATVKNLTMAEEYLADHFPRFPVMPGVMMLEAMTQTGAWLIRVTDDFAHSIVTLKQVRNLRFRNFVAPGQVLSVSATLLKHEPHETQLDVQGMIAEGPAVSGRLVLERSNLADSRPELASTDEFIKRSLREQLLMLRRTAPGARPPAEPAALNGFKQH